ncbi:hypothetical protein O3P69_016080 [Scylla paramamosain]|uniref:Uncharacterized protein n=1 Tax=Scylla paramamosain TaxID=85552 RepID=A0AAW0T9C9_SCYPA
MLTAAPGHPSQTGRAGEVCRGVWTVCLAVIIRNARNNACCLAAAPAWCEATVTPHAACCTAQLALCGHGGRGGGTNDKINTSGACPVLASWEPGPPTLSLSQPAASQRLACCERASWSERVVVSGCTCNTMRRVLRVSAVNTGVSEGWE